MTDQLEHDLRTLLGERAASVTADPAASEQAIADRLRAGDESLADIVPLAARSPRRRWLVAAAAAVLLVAGLAAAITRDDDEVTLVTPQKAGEPVIFTAPGDAEAVARAYLEDRLDAPGGAIDLRPSDSIGAADAAGFDWTRTDVDQETGGFVGLLQRDGRWAVLEAFTDGPSIDVAERDADSVTVHTTGPAGSYVQLSVHRLSGESLTAGGCGGEVVGAGAEEPTEPVGCSLVDEPIAEGDDPLTVRFSVVTQAGVRLTLEEQLLLVGRAAVDAAPEEDPSLGAPGDAPKDVAERVALQVFGEEYVTTAVEPARDSWTVTMDGLNGSIVADVMLTEPDRYRVLSIRSPELATVLSDGVTLQDGKLSIEVPVAGILTVTGLDSALEPRGETSATSVEPGGTYLLAGVEPWLEESTWVWVSILRADGERLQAFARR